MRVALRALPKGPQLERNGWDRYVKVNLKVIDAVAPSPTTTATTASVVSTVSSAVTHSSMSSSSSDTVTHLSHTIFHITSTAARTTGLEYISFLVIGIPIIITILVVLLKLMRKITRNKQLTVAPGPSTTATTVSVGSTVSSAVTHSSMSSSSSDTVTHLSHTIFHITSTAARTTGLEYLSFLVIGIPIIITILVVLLKLMRKITRNKQLKVSKTDSSQQDTHENSVPDGIYQTLQQTDPDQVYSTLTFTEGERHLTLISVTKSSD
ncbi:hypothetical protein Q5P01_026395 [Channa striata]|uniref:Uncharacterized protein n=1 Tax=Channa striata TaxID=64152 RepID=A0AA88LNQ8_CHASR|nr:hypothetical protein Q5P01_026395 [Channa striata]